MGEFVVPVLDRLFIPFQGRGIALTGLPRTGKGLARSILTEAYGAHNTWCPSTGQYLEDHLKAWNPDPDYVPTRQEKYEAGLRLQESPNEDYFVIAFAKLAYSKIVHDGIELFMIDALRRLKEAETAHKIGMEVVLLTRPLKDRVKDAIENPRPDEVGGIRAFLNQTLREHAEISKIARLSYVKTINNDGSVEDLKKEIEKVLLSGGQNAAF